MPDNIKKPFLRVRGNLYGGATQRQEIEIHPKAGENWEASVIEEKKNKKKGGGSFTPLSSQK